MAGTSPFARAHLVRGAAPPQNMSQQSSSLPSPISVRRLGMAYLGTKGEQLHSAQLPQRPPGTWHFLLLSQGGQAARSRSSQKVKAQHLVWQPHTQRSSGRTVPALWDLQSSGKGGSVMGPRSCKDGRGCSDQPLLLAGQPQAMASPWQENRWAQK